MSTKRLGGLGVEVLVLKNKCLLSKCLFKLLNEEGVWQELLQNKYLHSKTLAKVEAQPTDSPFWKGLMRFKEDFFIRGSFKIGKEETLLFWEDAWLGDSPLMNKYTLLYNIVQRQHVSVHDVLHNALLLNIGFRRDLVGNKWDMWSH